MKTASSNGSATFNFTVRAQRTRPVELDAFCYLILIVSKATVQALALDDDLDRRHPTIPWREIRATGNRLRHGDATVDLEVVYEVVAKGHIDKLIELAHSELDRMNAI